MCYQITLMYSVELYFLAKIFPVRIYIYISHFIRNTELTYICVLTFTFQISKQQNITNTHHAVTICTITVHNPCKSS